MAKKQEKDYVIVRTYSAGVFAGTLEARKGKDVFEYSVFGSPQQKIGDFTQSKLARWN